MAAEVSGGVLLQDIWRPSDDTVTRVQPRVCLRRMERMVSERRAEPRDERVSAVVWIRESGVTTATVVRNASRHGLCLDHVRDRQPGQTLEVQVIDHDHNIAFECEAVVRWSQPGPASRTGLQLVGCNPAWQRWVAARWGNG